MTAVAGARWNEAPDRDVDRGRRAVLFGALTLAAVAPLAAIPASAIAADPRGFVLALNPRYRARAVELTALGMIDTDRPSALRLLRAAVEHDLDPTGIAQKHPLRLYDLFAALGSATDRAALATLVRSATTDPSLLTRATLWADASRVTRPRLWRTINSSGVPLGIYIAPV